MYNKIRFGQSGFSLIELLVATALIGLLSVVLSQSLITTIRSNVKADVQKEIKENGDYALDYIGRIIRNGKKVTSGVTECKDSTSISGVKTITVSDPADISTTITCDNTNKITVNSSAITSTNVEVPYDTCSLSCSAQSSAPSVVTIQFNMKQAGGEGDVYQEVSQDFESSFTMRNK